MPTTETTEKTCERCGATLDDGNEAVLSFDDICQDCWEAECSDAWWEMANQISAIDAMIEAGIGDDDANLPTANRQ